jgi:hypothetical protein
MEDYIILKGRSGLEYYDQNGEGYYIDSELCAGDEYDYAIYIDSVVSLAGHLCPDEKKIQQIICRVFYLCKERKMNPKIFHDNT